MGKGGKVTPNSDGKVEVLINDRYYDVTNFRHPGGSVIGFYSNKPIDATVPFNNFHIRSARAFKILDKLPSRSSDLKQDAEEKKRAAMLADFVEFQRQLEKEGFFKPSLPHTIYRLSEILLMHAIGLYLFFQTPFAYARVLGIIILGVVSGRCGWLMHEGGHYSMTGNIQVDKLFQVVLYGIGCGMSGSWWRSQHNKHHSMPQKLSHDVDLNTLPLVCFTEKIVKRIGFLQKLWIRGQAVLFPVITTLLVALGWQFYLHPRHVVRAKNWAEAISMIARYALIGYFFVPKFGVSQTLLYYLAYTWVGANYIFLNFAVSHTHLPVVPKDDTKVNWIEYSAIYTMNVKPGPFKFINWWMGYLNFQIEHHLFPCMPQFRHPIISPRVKKFFEKHGFKYDQRSYVDALKVTFANLDKVGHDVFLG